MNAPLLLPLTVIASVTLASFAFAQVPPTTPRQNSTEVDRANKAALLQVLSQKPVPAAGAVDAAVAGPSGPLSARPNAARAGGEEEEPTQVRTSQEISGSGAVATPRPLPPGSRVSRPTGIGGGPLDNGATARPPNSGLARAGGEEEEIPQARTIEGVSPLENGATPRPPGGGLSRTTGVEDEMEDLDIQRRTTPGDLSEKPLPALDAPLRKGVATPGLIPPTAPASKPAETMAPIPVKQATRNLPPAITPGSGPAAVASASVQTGRPVYREGEPISVTFAGGSGSKTDWITIVPAGFPEDNWHEWINLNGETAGTRRFQQKLKPGSYEVRLYHDWPRGKFQVIARTTFEVR